MNLRTFSAPTFAQAMALVKTEMGGEAVILHTRTVRGRRWLGLRKRETVEITAGVGLNVTARPVKKPAGAAAGGAVGANGQAARLAAGVSSRSLPSPCGAAGGGP